MPAIPLIGRDHMPPVQLVFAYLRLLNVGDSYSAAAGCSTTSTATVSTTAATGGAAFFAGARLGLALATDRFVASFPRAALDNFLAFGRAFAPIFFWTFDDCFLRLAMIGPPDKRINARSKDNRP